MKPERFPADVFVARTMSTRTLRRIERLEKEQQRASRKRTAPRTKDLWIERVIQAPFVWVTQPAKAVNKHWREEGLPFPYEPFPRLAYFAPLFEPCDQESVIWIKWQFGVRESHEILESHAPLPCYCAEGVHNELT
jgi:hypothetical protein